MNAAEQIDQLIAGLGDWRGDTLAKVRKCFIGADPEIVEEWKWMGSPAWSRDGLIAVGDAHKAKVKVTFAYGARLPDPAGVFNGKDNGKTRRSIDIFEGDTVNADALETLIRAAISYNLDNLKKNAGKRARKDTDKAS
ncbi:DUF1801 domain-containing protein [Devosia neptuniae]|uniref:DUF1801 domain-containing protein n=1 Tax=Devosia TaxID=46913 RepID=UPI0022AEE442|nr:DUF1801 domain-containing protein [Devosia neptuniae]MCZ4344580.1 DUF1801 domain-containing protein [Devosia neptuniae]